MTVEYHILDGNFDRLPAVMDDLARRRVAVIAGAAITRSLSPGSIDFADRAGIDELDLQPEGGGHFAHLPQVNLGD